MKDLLRGLAALIKCEVAGHDWEIALVVSRQRSIQPGYICNRCGKECLSKRANLRKRGPRHD